MKPKKIREDTKSSKFFLFKHSALLIIASSSFAFFIANIYAKKILSIDDFNTWIYTISLVSFFSTFSLLGQDQLILRFSENENSSVIIDKSSIFVSFLSLIIFIPISLVLFQENTMSVSVTQLIILPVLFGFCKLGYQLFRLRKLFLLAQLSLNGWKLILVFIIPYAVFVGVVNLFMLSFFFGALGVLAVISKSKIKKMNKIGSIIKYGVGYFLSMGTMAIFVYFERFIIDGKISASEYADYLYFLTISLSMFTILASYFGLKEAVKYKKNFDLKTLNGDLLKVMWLIVPLSIIWSIFIYFIGPKLEIVVDIKSLLLVLIIGIFRCLYSILSSVMAIRMPLKDIISINSFTVLMFVTLYLFSAEFVTNIPLLLIVIAFAWFLRSSLIYYYIRRVEKFD